MKKLKLQLQNIYGEVVEESEIIIGENDTLIVQFPSYMPMNILSKCFEHLKDQIGTGGIVGLPEEIKLKVIKSR